jgi:hypothetical protein
VTINKLIPAVCLLVLILNSCCGNLDCITSNYYGQFRIVSASNGEDLIFGQSRIYNKSQIKFFALKGNDTSILELRPAYAPGTGYYSILYVYFYSQHFSAPVDTAYLQLTTNDVDTLLLWYEHRNTRCCGKIEEIESINYDGTIDLPGGSNIMELKK